ncbi:hypothetical protein [uncultured Ilumatobacter sp.]|uniref:hypothetical protein n=1 Tax=uncultured Ilumatobacter sp. TaxID=879968 RepID=UPI00374F86A5
MTDNGSDGEPDLWANTGNLPPVPPIPPTKPKPGRPAWLIPGAISLSVGALGALAIFLIIGSGDDDTISTDVSTSTTIAPETTVVPETTPASETTVAPETLVTPPTTVGSETTIAPESTGTPETTVPPASVAPTTTAPSEGTAPAAPGTALVAGTEYKIVHACTTSPVPGYQVTSFVAAAEFGPLVIEQGIDESNAFGLYSEAGIALDTREYTDLGDDGFAMLVLGGDGSFEVSANPSGLTTVECASLGTVRLSDPASPQFSYTHGIVNLCATNSPFRALGYLSEGGTIGIVDNGDDTAQITFDSANLFSATDPSATITAGERLQIDGTVSGSTIEADTTQIISIELDDTPERDCLDNRNP